MMNMKVEIVGINKFDIGSENVQVVMKLTDFSQYKAYTVKVYVIGPNESHISNIRKFTFKDDLSQPFFANVAVNAIVSGNTYTIKAQAFGPIGIMSRSEEASYSVTVGFAGADGSGSDSGSADAGGYQNAGGGIPAEPGYGEAAGATGGSYGGTGGSYGGANQGPVGFMESGLSTNTGDNLGLRR